jgi:hypothetical protein
MDCIYFLHFYTFDALVNNEFKSAVGKSEKLLNEITPARHTLINFIDTYTVHTYKQPSKI